ncbi:hypothetical protein Anas_01154 [Armadillidium nasatum]|uniref:Uncharacterized protein n=1 Tax=Armadillidium nasatum TaxID=96803 RepID=A0A5N5SX09_9CRUS|nr:hypothetical protein Anas_01154 [Armadillidium nasatum]
MGVEKVTSLDVENVLFSVIAVALSYPQAGLVGPSGVIGPSGLVGPSGPVHFFFSILFAIVSIVDYHLKGVYSFVTNKTNVQIFIFGHPSACNNYTYDFLSRSHLKLLHIKVCICAVGAIVAIQIAKQ